MEIPTLMLAFLSLLPIAAVALFLVILRWPASRAMPISYLAAVVLAFFVWKVSTVQIAASLAGLRRYTSGERDLEGWSGLILDRDRGRSKRDSQ